MKISDILVTICLGVLQTYYTFFLFYRSLLWLYKNVTGVKWDYTAPSSGYIGSILWSWQYA